MQIQYEYSKQTHGQQHTGHGCRSKCTCVYIMYRTCSCKSDGGVNRWITHMTVSMHTHVYEYSHGCARVSVCIAYTVLSIRMHSTQE
jgi:hypothetical protein